MSNEIDKSREDFIYWVEQHCKIKDKKGNLVSIKLTPLQKKLFDTIKEGKFQKLPLVKWRIK